MPQVLASPLFKSFHQGEAPHALEKLCDTVNIRLVRPRPPKKLKDIIRNSKRVKVGFASQEEMMRHRHEVAFQMWKPIVMATECNIKEMMDILEATEFRKSGNTGGGEQHLRRVLGAFSPATIQAHAKGYLRFQEWLTDEPIMPRTSEMELAAVLLRYVDHLAAVSKGRTVPRTALTHIHWAVSNLGLRTKWPTSHQQLAQVVACLHKKHRTHKPRAVFEYTAEQVKIMAEGVQQLEEPIDRLIIQVELMKIFGGLRTDDSINIVPLSVHLKEDQKVLVGICSKTKSTERTSGRIAGGMPFRVPIIPALDHTEWWGGFTDNVRLSGVLIQVGHCIPKDARVDHKDYTPGIATPANALAHLRRALAKLGIERAVADAVQFHSAKRTGMAVVQEYVGPWELTEGQRNALLHHRPTGKEQCAGAYNPRVLVAPVKKARIIWEEWISSVETKQKNHNTPWIWGRISKATMRFEGELRTHVMVPVGTARKLTKASSNTPMTLKVDGTEWEPMCDHLPAKSFRAPLIQVNAPQKHLMCVNCSKRSARCVPNFSSISDILCRSKTTLTPSKVVHCLRIVRRSPSGPH